MALSAESKPTVNSTMARVLASMNDTKTMVHPKFRFSMFSSGSAPSFNVSVEAGNEDVPGQIVDTILGADNATVSKLWSTPKLP